MEQIFKRMTTPSQALLHLPWNNIRKINLGNHGY